MTKDVEGEADAVQVKNCVVLAWVAHTMLEKKDERDHTQCHGYPWGKNEERAERKSLWAG